MMESEETRIEEELSYPILLSERVRSAAEEAQSFKSECSDVGKQVDSLSHLLRSAVRRATSSSYLYEHPIRRVASDVSKNLERALTLVRKCKKRRSVLHRLLTIVSAADFRKLSNVLESSIGDMHWLLSILDSESSKGGILISLPPIACNDPILCWIWSFIASVQMGKLTDDRIEAANELAALAKDNDRNKKIIVEEGGVGPLLSLLKERASPDAQVAAAHVILSLANDEERVRNIVSEGGVSVCVQLLGDSPMRVQIAVASLVGRMAEYDPVAREDFGESAIRPLVSLLSFETFVDDLGVQSGKQSVHSIVQISKEMEKNSLTMSKKQSLHNYSHGPYGNSYSLSHWEGSSRGGYLRKERENEKPEVKLELKTSCARALWMLARESVPNSRRITETKGLLCLAKLIEKEQGELRVNCLMTIMEITAAAEYDTDLRRAAFRTNSPAAKAVVDQLLRVIGEADSPALEIPAIRSIGSLARTFPARETRVISPLVKRLNHGDQDVATEASVSLGKFACPENYLCVEHSKAIIEFDGVVPLMRLLRGNERMRFYALVLLCYLAIHAGNNEALQHARVLTALEGADRMVATQHPELKELVSKAIYQLNLYHAGSHSQRLFVSVNNVSVG